MPQFNSHVDHDPRITLLGSQSAPEGGDCQPRPGCPGMHVVPFCECIVCSSRTVHEFRDAVCGAQRGFQYIRSFFVWEYMWQQPCRALRIWDGFQSASNALDRDFLSEMQDVHAHTQVGPWELLMNKLRHYATASHLYPVARNTSPRTEVPDGAGFD